MGVDRGRRTHHHHHHHNGRHRNVARNDWSIQGMNWPGRNRQLATDQSIDRSIEPND